MILASAQINGNDENTNANLVLHKKFIQVAGNFNADLIVFPEMSLTGYTRKEARNLVFKPDDERLMELSELANKYNIIIIAGAPIKINDNIYIGSFIIHPDNSVEIYTKQYLHTGEDAYFQSSFNYNPKIRIKDEIISLAICADITNPLHPEDAKKSQSTIYIPSIFFSKSGIQNGHDLLSTYARKYSLNILMSNFCGQLWNTTCGGRSSFWTKNGQQVSELDESEEGLIVVNKMNETWDVHKVKIDLNS
jgi:predicted amidohydrolase